VAITDKVIAAPFILHRSRVTRRACAFHSNDKFSGKNREQVAAKFKKQATLISSFSHFLLTETKICPQERNL
jgi:hypothetical protein